MVVILSVGNFASRLCFLLLAHVCACQGTAAVIRNGKPAQRSMNAFFATTSSARGSNNGGSKVNENENGPGLKIISKRFSIGGSEHDGEGRVIVLELMDIWLVNV